MADPAWNRGEEKKKAKRTETITALVGEHDGQSPVAPALAQAVCQRAGIADRRLLRVHLACQLPTRIGVGEVAEKRVSG